MARKQAVSIQETVETNEDFEAYLAAHKDQLICMEVYSDFCGPCLATGNAVRKGKLEIGQDRIAMVKCCADNIDALARFKHHSEPAFLFLVAKMQENLKIEEEYRDAAERLRVLTLAARKKRVNERLSQNIKRLNFIMFWPHCHQAHYDLYEKWDMINITVAAKDTFQLDERGAREALYMSDDVSPEKQVPPVPAYERYASISKTAREVRRDRYNAKLQKLKEEKEDAERLQAEQERLAREAQEEAARVEKQRLEEERMARIAAGLPADPEPPPPPPPPEPTEGEPAEGAEAVEGEATESGEGGEEKPETVETASEVATTITDLTPGEGGPEDAMLDEDVGEKEEEFNSDIEVEGEDYIPPGGLFVPGLYTPANELAKANGLAFFYPKQVADLAEVIETEYLPPHVLVIFPIDKRYDVQEVVNLYSSEILNMGIFVGEDPYSAEHVAYSIKQYDKMERPRRYFDRLALMVSRKRSLPLLQLAGLNPVYISSDVISGERECLAMFPVGYGDDHEEIESVEEEEVVVTEQPQETVQETVAAEERPEDEDEDEEEEPTM
ncbi:hypothetical protein B5X24_HaOG210124 [Helicoverpa armigera]|uniref:DUF4746 domain-containing protein n=1 Tax=Helicoverpa armigera TaxID=29058 RepID=A0A2W1BK08_HELAM|nr:hypothetical protein B5X24_HaOG210124 [Helicoverpa armigera]